jgi:hypothetical protein
MAQINFASREVNCKIVYYGPGRSGKTTNLEVVHSKAPKDCKGEMVSIATETDRTLFFDFLPLDLGMVAGMRTRFQLYTVPGQVYYDATRKLVLQGADGVIFVADSQRSMREENLESLQNLEKNLKENGLDINDIPIVLQWNKRDLEDIDEPDYLNEQLNRWGAPTYEAIALNGDGVFPTLKALSSLVITKLNETQQRTTQRILKKHQEKSEEAEQKQDDNTEEEIAAREAETRQKEAQEKEEAAKVKAMEEKLQAEREAAETRQAKLEEEEAAKAQALLEEQQRKAEQEALRKQKAAELELKAKEEKLAREQAAREEAEAKEAEKQAQLQKADTVEATPAEENMEETEEDDDPLKRELRRKKAERLERERLDRERIRKSARKPIKQGDSKTYIIVGILALIIIGALAFVFLYAKS